MFSQSLNTRDLDPNISQLTCLNDISKQWSCGILYFARQCNFYILETFYGCLPADPRVWKSGESEGSPSHRQATRPLDLCLDGKLDSMGRKWSCTTDHISWTWSKGWCTFSMGKDESIWRKSTKRDTKKKFCFWRLRTLPWIRKKLYWQLITMDKIILICPEDIYMAWLSRFVLLDVEYMRVMTRFIQETRATKAQFSFPPWNTLYLKS